MRIILHIGAWKTGSSAIQTFMAEARDALLAQGVGAPREADDALGRGRILSQLRGADEAAGPLLDEIARLKANGLQTLVLSNEHYWPISSADIGTIGARLRSLSDDVRVLMYVRPQEDMWRSIYCQQAKKMAVRSGAALWGTDDFVPPVFASRALHYHQTLQLFADVFGQEAIAVRTYDRKDFVGGDVVTDFLSFMGLDWTGFDRLDRDVNRSVGWKGVAFGVWLADLAQKSFDAQNSENATSKIYAFTVRRVAAKLEDPDWIGRNADPMTTAEKAAIRAHYAKDNQRLFETYFDGKDVFPPPGDGRGDSVSPASLPRRDLNMAKRLFLRLSEKHGCSTEGLEHIFAPEAPSRKHVARGLLNALPFRR